jgi:hypothetical protein
MNISMIDLIRMLHSLAKGIILETVLICFMIFLLFFTSGYFGLLWDTYGQNDLYLNLSSNNGNSGFPQISIMEDKIYVIWTDNTTGNGDIYFKRSMDNGGTFGGTENLSNNTGASLSPHIAASGNNVYVIWTDNTTGNGDIYFKRSMDNGGTFGGTENLSNNLGMSSEPDVTLDQEEVYITWTDNTTGNGDVYFKASSDSGFTFSSIKNLSNNTGASLSPHIAASGNNVYVIWTDNTTGNGDIYFKASLENGNKFKGKKILAKNIGNSLQPQMAVSHDGSLIFGVWKDNTKYDPPENGTSRDFDLLFRTSSNQGGNFSDRNIIGKNVGDFADFSQIAVPAKTRDAAVVWSDVYKYRQPATSDIFFQAIIGNGTTLAEPINLSNNEGNSTMPNIAFSADTMANVVWSDSTTGNGDIYFARIK